MQNGEFIKDRWIVKMINETCAEVGAEVRSFSDDWVLELRKGEAIGHVFGYKFSLNSATAAGIAQDKVAAYEVMMAHDVDAVEHYLIRSSDDSLWDRLPAQKNIVVKPLVGTGGRGVGLYDDIVKARQEIKKSKLDAWAVSPFYNIVREVRLIILDNVILLAYEKQPVLEDGLKFFNLGKGAMPIVYQPSVLVQELALSAIKAIGLRVGVVDIALCKGGEMKVLEVNDGVMMENFARHSNVNRILALAVYRILVKEMLGQA